MRKETRNPNRLTFQRRGIVASYLQQKEIVENRLWRIVGNKLLTFFNNEWLSEQELREKLPLLSQPCLLSNPENPNRSKNYSV